MGIIFGSDQEGATFLNQQKMKFLCLLFTIIAAYTISLTKAQTCEDCKYDCPLIGKEIYEGKVLGCGYNMAQDWGTCAAICKLVDTCTHWTWKIDWLGKECCLRSSLETPSYMENYKGVRSLLWPGASGEKMCQDN